MRYKLSSIILWSLVILIGSLTISTNRALSQSGDYRDDWAIKVTDLPPIRIEISVSDLQRIDKIAQEHPLLRELNAQKDQTIKALQESLDLAKKENELLERELALQKQILQIKDMEIAVQQRAIQDLKDINDRALKLAETAKPPVFGNFQLMGLAAAAAFALGVLAGGR